MSEREYAAGSELSGPVVHVREGNPHSPVRGIQPRRAILAMPEYHPPLAGRNALRLDFNENTHAPSPRVREALGRLTLESFTIYPEREPVERAVAQQLGLSAEQVLLTNAVDEAIHLVCFTFLEEGDECLFSVPSFFMYDVNAVSMGASVIRIQAGESLAFPYDRFLSAITPRTKLVILASPNNPTGTVLTRQQIHTIAKAAPQAIVMVDEAYFHFFGETVMSDLGVLPNVIVARTFSKAYGLANLRAGLLAGPAELIAHVRKAASPYNVNGVALAAVNAAVGDTEYLDWYVEQIRVGRERVAHALTQLGVPFWPSHANFLLMRIGPKHRELIAAMRTRGVLLRDRSSDPGLQGCVRITIGVEDQIETGIAALRESLEAIGWTPDEITAPDHTPKEPNEYE